MPFSAPTLAAQYAQANRPKQPSARVQAKEAREAKAAAKAAEKAEVTLTEKITVKPMGKTKAAIYKGIAGAFSTGVSKNVVKWGSVIAAAATVGVIIGTVVGPHLPGLFAALAASSAFPPVMIAIAATVGVTLLAFGIFKVVKHIKKSNALDEKAKATQKKNPSFSAVPAQYSMPLPPVAEEPASEVAPAPVTRVPQRFNASPETAAWDQPSA